MKDKFAKEEVIKFLRSVSIMSVAINYQRPVSSILLFAVDDEMNFYFATHKDSIKAKALEINPEISMSVWEYSKMLVQASGIASLVGDANEKETAMNCIVNALDNIENFWPPVLQITGDEYVVYKIETNWCRVLDLTDNTIQAQGELFYQII